MPIRYSSNGNLTLDYTLSNTTIHIRHLKRSDRITHIQAEALIKKCYTTNISIHNPIFSKLLRRLVGEINWKIAKEYQLQYYLRKMSDEEIESYYNKIKSEMEIGEIGKVLSEMKTSEVLVCLIWDMKSSNIKLFL